MAPGLMKLPAELLFHIYSLLDDLRDVNSLARTNTYLRCLFLSRRDEIVDWIMESSPTYSLSLVLIRVLTGQIEGDPRHNLPLAQLHELLVTGVYTPLKTRNRNENPHIGGILRSSNTKLQAQADRRAHSQTWFGDTLLRKIQSHVLEVPPDVA